MDWGWTAPFLVRPTEAEEGADGRAITDANVALILLNVPFSVAKLRHFWAMAGVRICADGGANRLAQAGEDLVPDMIIGDLDSASPEVLDSFRARGVEVRDLSEDQDTTDLEKAFQASRAAGCSKFVIAGQHAGVEGRLDHTFGIANTLHEHKDMPIVVIGDDSCLWLLSPGEHNLPVPHAADVPHCGLVPLGAPCEAISTRGLRWNMDGARMEFGGLVSTSNRVEPSSGGAVWVKTSGPVLWMCQL
mmetsp:Transcript_41237/g.113740  ORF Transcript_41237/g.113740 Transcript_41237/m.113740 type:complete len:247 (+) Transcript_41237:124-864(+)